MTTKSGSDVDGVGVDILNIQGSIGLRQRV